MNSLKVFILGCLLVFSVSLRAQKKAVFILIDGVPPDVLESTPTPGIDEIAGKGGYTHAYLGGERGGYSESPTISAVGYNHLLTGTWTNKHNVWGNTIKNPNYNYPTIFRIVKDVKPDIKTAIFSTWLDNRTKLIGEGLPETGNIKMDYAFDGFEKDNDKFPHSNPAYIFEIDEHVSKEAGRYILENGPDLSWVYLEYTDDIGHKYGDSPEMKKAVMDADIQIGRIWNAVKQRMEKSGEEWMVVVTTDHGRDPKTGKSHGKQSDRERSTWIVTNYQLLNEHFHQTPGIIDIAPSILRFLDIDMPTSVKEEIDGVPFIGKVSISNLKATRTDGGINLTWNALEPNGKAEIWVTTTNNYKEGKKDDYKLVGATELATGSFQFNVANMKSDFYKILVKAPHNWVNYWIVE
jgi:predicted AlkP superfamily pyrophosphatase or phosphodiesterase